MAFLLLSFSHSLPPVFNPIKNSYPSGEQWCVCLQLMHEMRSSEEDDEAAVNAFPLRPGFVDVDVTDDADDVVVVVLGALLLFPPPPAASSRSR